MVGTGSPKATMPQRALTVGAVLLLCVMAVAVRLPLLELGFDADEVGTVTDASFWGIYDNPETGVNPPLWRWMWCLVFEPWEAATYGRRFSLVCSVLAVALGWRLGRRTSGVWVGGLLAASLLAFHPWTIRYGAMFRVYAFWSAVMLVHLLAWDLRWCRTGRVRAVATVGVVVSGMVLPWIHYVSVPVLLALGLTIVAVLPGRRWDVAALVPSAVGALPLVPYVLFEEGRRVEPVHESLGSMMLRLVSLDLHPPGFLWGPVSRVWERATGAWPDLGVVMAISLVTLLGVAIAAGRRQPPIARLVLGGTLGVLVGAWALGHIQYVRPPTLVMLVTLAGSAVASAGRVVPRAVVRAGVVGALAVWWGSSLPQRYHTQLQAWRVEEGPPALAASWRRWDAVRGDRPFVVVPMHSLWTLWFHLGHDVPRAAPRGPRCDGWSPCFEHEGVAWAGVREVGDGSTLRGIVVLTEAWRPEGFASSCTTLEDHGTWGVWDCAGPKVEPVP